jgi:hypothetical protein
LCDGELAHGRVICAKDAEDLFRIGLLGRRR